MDDYKFYNLFPPSPSIISTAAAPVADPGAYYDHNFYPSPPSPSICTTDDDPVEPNGYEYPSFYASPSPPPIFANGFALAGLGYSDDGFFDRQPQVVPRIVCAPHRVGAACWGQPTTSQLFEPWPLTPEQSIAADVILYGRGPRVRPRLPVFEAICPTERL